MSPGARPQRTAIAVFLGIAFGGAWALWLVRWWTGADVIAAGGMVFVGLATFVTVRWAQPGDTGLGRPAVRKLVAQCALALGLILGLAVTAVLIGAVAGVHRLDLTGLSGLRQIYQAGSGAGLLLTALVNAAALFALVLPLAFCEEWGWRGFLLPRLMPLGTWPALLLSGVIWGLWHLPGYVGPGRPGFLPFLIFCLPLGVLFGWMRMRFGSVWPSTIAHAANNTFVTAFVNIAFTDAATLAAPDPWSLGLSGWPGWIAMSVFIAVLATTGSPRRAGLTGTDAASAARWPRRARRTPPRTPPAAPRCAR
jgi:membrane protease YdiL (CAAX protease family)